MIIYLSIIKINIKYFFCYSIYIYIYIYNNNNNIKYYNIDIIIIIIRIIHIIINKSKFHNLLWILFNYFYHIVKNHLFNIKN